MDGPEVLPDSRGKSVWLQVLNAALAFLAVILCLEGSVLIASEPWVGARPGVESIPGPNEATPLTDCGGTSLHVIRDGAQVVAETSQLARDAEAACQRVAWISVVIAVLLFLLIPVSLYGAARLKKRYDRGGRLAGPKHLRPSGERMKSDGPLWEYQPQPSLWDRIRATTLGRARRFFDV
jgi:hypothetical protein